ncbi:hypothetical protein PsorP6_016837 [Peronosclerospora sorghi]|uniref:Uncharacterized protein n=1 Tax=Peronosclerospora sorghi TaxID=230839 RepID=A0ACC0WE76_9STRA|nr:hypothetical protein PsorP6_016837 [Peronosclerospora sorghi]
MLTLQLQQRPHVGVSSVFSLCRRLNPLITAIAASKQGSTDPEAPWSKARLVWATQLAIRFGALTWDNQTMRHCPPVFDINLLGPLELTSVVHWDENHKTFESKTQIRFLRGGDGQLDPINGKMADEKTYQKLKYTGESRFSLGCAMIQLLDGTIEGRR